MAKMVFDFDNVNEISLILTIWGIAGIKMIMVKHALKDGKIPDYMFDRTINRVAITTLSMIYSIIPERDDVLYFIFK